MRSAADGTGMRLVSISFALLLAALLASLLAACAAPDLSRVQSWAMQLQGLENPAARERLARAGFDLIVVDPVSNVRGLEQFDTAAMVRLMREHALCLAYFNVGQAENYRVDWGEGWRAPTKDRPGAPAVLLTVDPDGWEGDFPVAYWENAWIEILERRVDRVARQGFDGIYCDWVLAFDEPAVQRAAKRAGIDAPRAMADLLRDLRQRGRRINPQFRVVIQNGAALFDAVPDMHERIDGYVQEPLSFAGVAGAAWDDAAAGDRALPVEGDWSTATMIESLRSIRARGVPTFVIDYALDPRNARLARERARSVGAVPFVTRVPLDRVPLDYVATR